MSVVGEMEGSGTELISKSDSNPLSPYFVPLDPDINFSQASRFQERERLSFHPQFINAPKLGLPTPVEWQISF